MSSLLTADLFVEDRAHEEFLKAILTRIAKQEGGQLDLHIRSARGGHGRVLQELVVYQKSVLRSPQSIPMPDLLFIAIDANCQRFTKARESIVSKVENPFRERAVIACPDPHIERWYLADPESFVQVVGIRPQLGKKKCERDWYKAMPAKAIREAGHPPTLGGVEFAKELADQMDFFRAGKTESSLRHFLDETIKRLRQMKA
ncbi:MAG: hypothetical protein KIS67_26660 [Verrucomicrobiae bacterium]|nr:hypothetical protein [Verrucomicrobiae bacterium]